MSSRKWRKERRRLATCTTWRLLTGRNETRVTLNLGEVSADEAQRALDAMQRLEDEGGGKVDRVIAWHRESSAAVVRFLSGDPAEATELDRRKDYASMPLVEYIAEVFAPWRASAVPASWENERRALNLICRELGRYRLREIDAHLVADYLDSLVVRRGKRAGQPMSGNTKRLYRAALQAVLHYAYRQRHLPTEPRLSDFRIKGSTRTVRQKSDPLSLDELIALMDASTGKHRAMWAVGGGQGLRPSELVRLDWQHIDWDRATLQVPGSKTALSKSEVPLVPLALHELRVWWMSLGRPAKGLIFPSSTGEAYGSSGYRAALRTAAKRAGIERHVTPYLLRDSCATICWSLRIDIDTTRRLLRHTDETMLRRVYQRPRPEELGERVAMFMAPSAEEHRN